MLTVDLNNEHVIKSLEHDLKELQKLPHSSVKYGIEQNLELSIWLERETQRAVIVEMVTA